MTKWLESSGAMPPNPLLNLRHSEGFSPKESSFFKFFIYPSLNSNVGWGFYPNIQLGIAESLSERI